MQLEFIVAISEENLFIYKDFSVWHYLLVQIYDTNHELKIKIYLFLIKSSKNNKWGSIFAI